MSYLSKPDGRCEKGFSQAPAGRGMTPAQLALASRGLAHTLGTAIALFLTFLILSCRREP